MSPVSTDPERQPITLVSAVVTRRVLNRRITAAAILVGLVAGAIIGQLAGSFIAGVWIGLIVGFFLPGPIGWALDRAGRLPERARYRPVSLRDLRR